MESSPTFVFRLLLHFWSVTAEVFSSITSQMMKAALGRTEAELKEMSRRYIFTRVLSLL